MDLVHGGVSTITFDAQRHVKHLGELDLMASFTVFRCFSAAPCWTVVAIRW